MDRKKFGSYIKESRNKKNFTQQELADLLFVDASTVSKWERGVSYPDITLVPDICRILEISEHELIESCHDAEYQNMKKDAARYNNMKKGTFWTLNIIYIVAILTCFIVNVAVNHTLSWFFIVLSSIVCAYSFCPTITWISNKYKKLVFICSTFVSLFLLFLTCSIYTSNYWFMIATLGVLLAYFITFYPILFESQVNYLDKEKYSKLSKWFLFSYVTGMLIIITLLLVVIHAYEQFNLGLGLLITFSLFIVPVLLGILNLFEGGKTLMKPVLISIGSVIALLIIASASFSIYLKTTIVSNTYEIKNTYTEVQIEGKNLAVNIYLSNDNKVVYKENKKVSVAVKVVDNILMVNQTDERKFYEKLFDLGGYEVNLYLSQELINTLNIKSDTGDIEIKKGFTFNNVYVNNFTGDIEFESTVSNNLNMKNSTGDIEIENSNIDNDVTIETNTGDIELVNVNCNKLDIKVDTGNTKLINTIVKEDLTLNGDTGSVKFDAFDASNIYVNLDTGDVKGTIVTSKIFIVKSKTGRVRVPETLTGGVCKISTDTGDIVISYK